MSYGNPLRWVKQMNRRYDALDAEHGAPRYALFMLPASTALAFVNWGGLRLEAVGAVILGAMLAFRLIGIWYRCPE